MRREPPQPAPPGLTSDGIRNLFRDVAKAIHPDLTHDERARTRRQALMAEANRAYADGDEEQLRLILAAWQQSPEAVQGTDAAAICWATCSRGSGATSWWPGIGSRRCGRRRRAPEPAGPDSPAARWLVHFSEPCSLAAGLRLGDAGKMLSSEPPGELARPTRLA